MDIPPPLSTAAHSPPPPPTNGTGLSFAHLEWYQNLWQHIDILSLDLRAPSEEQDRYFGALKSQHVEIL